MPPPPRAPTPELFAATFHSEGAGTLGKLLGRPTAVLGTEAARFWGRATGRQWLARTRLFWGEPFVVRMPDAIGIHLVRYGYFERELTAFYLRQLRPGMTFWDVGAHFGFFSVLAARLCGPTGSIHALEPTAGTFAVLRENLAPHPQATAWHRAAYRDRRTLHLQNCGVERAAFNHVTADPGNGGGEPVEAIPLDELARDTGRVPDFVKLDAEKAEIAVLEGFARTLTDHAPVLSIEVGDGDEDPGHSRSIVEKMRGFGYRPHLVLPGGELREAPPRERYTYDNLVFAKPAALPG